MVGILGIGRAEKVLAFSRDENGNDKIIEKEKIILSWSADHRVLDGATVAKCAEVVGAMLENFEFLGVVLK